MCKALQHFYDQSVRITTGTSADGHDKGSMPCSQSRTNGTETTQGAPLRRSSWTRALTCPSACCDRQPSSCCHRTCASWLLQRKQEERESGPRCVFATRVADRDREVMLAHCFCSGAFDRDAASAYAAPR